MRKKRSVSDLLREEIKKKPDSDSVPANLEPEPAQPPSDASEVAPQSRAKRAPDTPNPLEKIVSDMNVTLEGEKKRASALHSQITLLEAELKTQKDLVKKLSDELAQAKALQPELEAQKELVKKLFTQLQEAQTLQTELEEEKKLVSKLYVQLQKAETVNAELEEQKQLVQQLSAQLEGESSMEVSTTATYGIQPYRYTRYVAVSAPSTELSNEDIGWFD